MKKSSLKQKVAKRLKSKFALAEPDGALIFDEIMSVLEETLSEEDLIKLPGVGSLYVLERAIPNAIRYRFADGVWVKAPGYAYNFHFKPVNLLRSKIKKRKMGAHSNQALDKDEVIEDTN